VAGVIDMLSIGRILLAGVRMIAACHLHLVATLYDSFSKSTTSVSLRVPIRYTILSFPASSCY